MGAFRFGGAAPAGGGSCKGCKNHQIRGAQKHGEHGGDDHTQESHFREFRTLTSLKACGKLANEKLERNRAL